EKVLDRRARLKQETAVQKERTPMAVTNWCQETTSAASVSPTSLVLENGLLLTRRGIAARERPCGNGRANGSHPAEAGPKQELSPLQIGGYAEWRDDQACRCVFSPAQIAAGLLDEAVRRRLAVEGVPPERIEIEFRRIMDAR